MKELIRREKPNKFAITVNEPVILLEIVPRSLSVITVINRGILYEIVRFLLPAMDLQLIVEGEAMKMEEITLCSVISVERSVILLEIVQTRELIEKRRFVTTVNNRDIFHGNVQ